MEKGAPGWEGNLGESREPGERGPGEGGCLVGRGDLGGGGALGVQKGMKGTVSKEEQGIWERKEAMGGGSQPPGK